MLLTAMHQPYLGGDEAAEAQGPAIPCFRCGVCCVKWQPLLDPQEQRRLARDLGLALRAFQRRYTRTYPPRRGWRQLKSGPLGCVFLAFREGRAACSIHPARPQVCRDWLPGLDRSECREGLRTLPGPALLTSRDLYEAAEEARAFVEAVGHGRPAAVNGGPS